MIGVVTIAALFFQQMFSRAGDARCHWYIFMYINVHTRARARARAHTHTHTHTHKQAHVHTHTHMHTYMHTHTHTHTHTHRVHDGLPTLTGSGPACSVPLGNTFSKVVYIVNLYGKYTRALIFQNFCPASQRRGSTSASPPTCPRCLHLSSYVTIFPATPPPPPPAPLSGACAIR